MDRLPPEATRSPAEVEALLAAVFRDARDPVGLSRAGVIRALNPAAARMFGYEEGELVGTGFLERIAPEARPTLVEYVRRAAAGEPVPGLYRADALRRDGSRFLMEIRTTSFRVGDEPYSLAMLRDVGASAQTTESLYEAIFTRNTAVKLLIDPNDGRIVDANPSAAQFYGWSMAELRRMRIDQINTLPAEEVRRRLHHARQDRVAPFRFQHRVASGEVRNVEVHTGSVEVDGRTLLLSIVQDTSDRDALEERLRQAQQLEAIGRLAGGVAHDFNNLLTLMLTCGDLLRRELPAEGPANRHLDDLMHAALRASELTRDLLAVGQRQQRTPTPVAVDRVLERIAGLLRSAAAPAALTLASEADLVVEADPGQLEQVVTNLVLNARDATAGRGSIEVRAARCGERVSLWVRDDGHGMDAATRARVFEPFFTTRPGRGAGLGLASVYGIVTQSGGTISVDSEVGQGATFCVSFPLVPGRSTG